jgi:hypothetical protein
MKAINFPKFDNHLQDYRGSQLRRLQSTNKIWPILRQLFTTCLDNCCKQLLTLRCKWNIITNFVTSRSKKVFPYVFLFLRNELQVFNATYTYTQTYARKHACLYIYTDTYMHNTSYMHTYIRTHTKKCILIYIEEKRLIWRGFFKKLTERIKQTIHQ